MKISPNSILVASALAATLLAAATPPAQAAMVNCASKGNTIQKAVDAAEGPTTIHVVGTCTGNVTIAKDDITLSGNSDGHPCDRGAPGGTGTIDGTVVIDGARAAIEFLTVTGSGTGVEIINRATAKLTCNDISGNMESGIFVVRASNAVLRGNTVSGKGARMNNPNVYFDAGIFVGDASSVYSVGNTYEDNQYAAIDIGKQSVFRNGDFQPVEPGHPADPDERDVITERGCDPATGGGCFTNDFGPVAIDLYDGGSADLRNADVNGEVDSEWQSAFRVDGDAAVQGVIHNFVHSVLRIRNRASLGDRMVTFSGTLQCDVTSATASSNVQCGQTCSGTIPGTCVP